MKPFSFQEFQDYLKKLFADKKSGTVNSYLNAIEIIDNILSQKDDIFNLRGKSIMDLKDPLLISKIIEYIKEEENKFKREEKSIFDLGKTTQSSYPRGGFCSAAIKKLGDYINHSCAEEASDFALKSNESGQRISSHLSKLYDINDKGTDKEVRVKHRIGQEIFRSLILKIYSSRCCITGLEIPEILRASHIIPWSESVATRLNPQNGLCLSATYDAAFDRHLFTLDENYRIVLSPSLKDLYNSEAFRKYFLSFEGKKIILPSTYKPSQEFLEKHRASLVS